MGVSEFSMNNSTAPSLINTLQRVAKLGPDALKQLGGEIKVRGLIAGRDTISSTET